MKTFYAPNRKAWREWFSKNHGKEKEVWLIFYKKASEKTSIPYNDAVEEALCFGWIDSVQKKFNSESGIQRFSPRKPKSNWSLSNRERAKRLIKNNLMTKFGFKVLPEDL